MPNVFLKAAAAERWHPHAVLLFDALNANTFPFVADFSSTPSAFSTPSSSSSANAGDARPSVIGWTDTRHRGDGRDGDTSGSSSRYS